MGMRNIKTAIAVVICVLVAKIFKLEYSFYAAIAAVITMENTVSNSFRAGKNRMLGTLVGATIGFLCALIMPGNALLCGIGVVMVIFLCNKLKWSKSVSIACIVFMAIMVNLNGKNPLLYSSNRILDTFIGIIVAMVVNYFICPPNYVKEIKDKSNSLEKQLQEIINHGCRVVSLEKIKSLNKCIGDLKKQIDLHENEFRIKDKRIEEIERIKEKVELEQDILNHLKYIHNIGNKGNVEAKAEELIINYSISEIENNLKLIEIQNFSNTQQG